MFTSGSPNSGQLSIGIALVLQDRFSNQAREASSSIRRLHQDVKNLTNANLSAVQSIAGMATAAGSAAIYGMGSAVYEGSRFIDVMTFVGAIADNTGLSFDKLNKKAKTLGRDTMFTSQEIASAMQYMAMAGQNTTEIYNNISAAADLANATMATLGGKGGTADIMTNVMRMFQIDSTERNSTRIADVLTRAVTRSNMNLYDLGETIKYAGTTTTNLGATLEQVAAMAGVMGDAGLQGSMAGTAIANAYRYLARSIGNPDFKGNKALTKLGLGKSDFVDTQGRMIDMGLAIEKIAKSTSKLGEVDRFNLLIDIFGVRGERSASVMMKSLSRYSELLHEINNSAGAAAKVREERMARLYGGIEKVVSTYENLRSSFAEAIEPTLLPYLNSIGKLLENIQSIFDSKAGPFIAAAIAGGTVFLTMAAGVTALKAAFRLMFNDSTVSLRNMFLVMSQGWKGAKVQATEYLTIEAAILAQRKAGILGQGVGNATLWAGYAAQNQGKYIGKVMAKATQGGQMRYYANTAAGGTRRISGALASRYAQRFAPSMVGGGIAVAAGAAAARFGVGTILKGILGAITGPWGLAVITLLTFMPTIIGLFKGNTDALNENTAATKMSLEDKRKANIAAANVTTDERVILVENMINKFAALLMDLNTGGKGDIVINIDGQTTFRKNLEKSKQEQVINVGGK